MADEIAKALLAAELASLPIPGTFTPQQPNISFGERMRGFSHAISGDIQDSANSVASALMAPGNALRGEYNEVEIMPDGSVNPVNSALIEQALNMAVNLSVGSSVVPKPTNAISMGVKMYHGSPDPRWMDSGEAFSSANPVTAPSKYMFGSPKRSVAETYAGISEMQLWKAQEGLGRTPSPNAGIRQIELNDGAKVLKVRDVAKSANEMGFQWGGADSLERLLDAAKSQGYDAVQIVQDGGNYAILNPEAVKKITVPR